MDSRAEVDYAARWMREGMNGEKIVNETEWLSCADPMAMLWFLREHASDRKLRLTACAYCRSVWALLGRASRKAVLLGEQMVDEPVRETHREAVVRAAIDAVCRFEEVGGD